MESVLKGWRVERCLTAKWVAPARDPVRTPRSPDTVPPTGELWPARRNLPSWLCMVVARSLLGVRGPPSLVAISQNCDGGHGVVDLPQVALGEIDSDRANVLLQAFDPAAAGNRNDPRLLRKQPGQRDLCRRRLFLRSDPGEQVDYDLVGTDGLRRKARVATAN